MNLSFMRYALLQGLLAAGVFASPIAVDGTWHEFAFGTAPSAANGCGGLCTATINPVAEQVSASPWTFAGPATLTILDLFLTGDRFEAFDNGVSLGVTSIVPNTAANTCANDIACALAAPAIYSRLVVGLGAGPHSLTIAVTQNATGSSGGAAVFQLVPEPGTFVLLTSGFALVGIARRFRSRS